MPALTPGGVYALTVVTPDGAIGRTALEVRSPDTARTSEGPQLWGTDHPAGSASTGPDVLGITLLSVGTFGLFAGSTLALARGAAASPAGSSRESGSPAVRHPVAVLLTCAATGSWPP